jgi:uncharacterized membrane protein YGL010W
MTTARTLPAKLDVLFQDYASHHQTMGNKVTHTFGIPMIVIGVFGLLGALPVAGGLTGSEIFRLDGGVILWALAVLWYLTLDWKLAVPFSLYAFGLYLLGRAIAITPLLWGIFVVGWVFQGIGHAVYEKKSPSFLSNVRHLLIGPFWLFAKWIGYAK